MSSPIINLPEEFPSIIAPEFKLFVYKQTFMAGIKRPFEFSPNY